VARSKSPWRWKNRTQADSFLLPIRKWNRVKVRQQLQLSSLSLTTGQTTTRSTNAFRTLVEMVKHEGLGSVYKGLSGSMLRESIYSSVLFLALTGSSSEFKTDVNMFRRAGNSGIRMGGYDLVKSLVCKANPSADPQGFGTKLAAGMASG
jgi:hypothetical protein